MRSTHDMRVHYEREQTIHRRQAVLCEMYHDWTLTRPREEALPTPTDIAFSPYFVVETHAPSSFVVDEDRLRQLDFLFPYIVSEWRESVMNKLVRLLPSRDDMDAPQRTARDLDLATTFFRCVHGPAYSCTEPISYPRVLVHKCLRHNWALLPLGLDSGAAKIHLDMKIQCKHLESIPWNLPGDVIEYDADSAALVARFCELCGLDPEVVTARELDERNARFAFRKGNGRRATTWRALVSVRFLPTFGCMSLCVAGQVRERFSRSIERPPLDSYTLLEGDDVAKILDTEAYAVRNGTNDEERAKWSCWQCTICRRHRGSRNAVLGHVCQE